MGWTRKLLRVDLTAGTCKSEPLNMKWADEYLGSRGLATQVPVRGDRSEGRSAVARPTS